MSGVIPGHGPSSNVAPSLNGVRQGKFRIEFDCPLQKGQCFGGALTGIAIVSREPSEIAVVCFQIADLLLGAGDFSLLQGRQDRAYDLRCNRILQFEDVFQATIDAIDRAITDERSIKDKGKPVSLVDLE